ncbi:MAG TPA: carboxypeptidase regulatory-like domain-containing protein [Gemmatimonadaceae bacterium]|nr:carboxypeptidase regulatory-like domain-containing protein [Gemmatimonadaceae bacterium]
MTTRVALVLMLLPACVASAQSVRGTVSAQGRIEGLPGVVVQLVDTTGRVLNRALTNERGEYRINAPGAGRYAIRTLRIGFRPITSEAISLILGQDLVRDVSLDNVAVRLDTVRVADRSVCGGAAESSAAIALAWEQARTALAAAQLTAGNRALTATIVGYERTLDANNDRVRKQTAGVTTGFTTKPWKALPARDLRRLGYVVTDANGVTTYYAPDLDALSAPEFITDHCFKRAETKDDSRLGIAFEPSRERSEIVDIRGVLWLDRTSSELRALEYRYENVARELEGHRAGGSMEFGRLRDGGWAITRWQIRMPVLEKVIRRNGQELRVAEVLAVGGELSFAMRGQDTLYARAPMVFAGVVMDSVTRNPVAGARLRVAGAAMEDTTDDRGRFSIAGILPGQYDVEVFTPALDRLRTNAVWPVTVVDGGGPLEYQLPPARQIAQARAATFVGVVLTDPSQTPIAEAEVAIPALELAVMTDATGRFRMRDVVPGAHDVVVRRVGYGPLNTNILFLPSQTVEKRVLLSKMVALDTIAIRARATAVIPSFEEHRKIGLGKFLTREDLAKQEGRRLSDILTTIPGLQIMPGYGNHGWVINTRATRSLRMSDGLTGQATSITHSTLISDFDKNLGAKPGVCYSQVYLNRSLVYRGWNRPPPAAPEPLFDINSINPASIEAIEWYSGSSETPMRYTGNNTRCGVIVIHTRVSR